MIDLGLPPLAYPSSVSVQAASNDDEHAGRLAGEADMGSPIDGPSYGAISPAACKLPERRRKWLVSLLMLHVSVDCRPVYILK